MLSLTDSRRAKTKPKRKKAPTKCNQKTKSPPEKSERINDQPGIAPKKKKIKKECMDPNSLNVTVDEQVATPNCTESIENVIDQKHVPIEPNEVPKEIKQTQTPKKREAIQKKDAAMVKKPQKARRQFTSISAIIECIESVVRGADVSVSETASVKIKSEGNEGGSYDSTFDSRQKFSTSSKLLLPVKNEPDELSEQNASYPSTNHNSSGTTAGLLENSSTAKRDVCTLQMGKTNPDLFSQSAALNGLALKTTTKKPNRTPNKSTKLPTQTTSMHDL